MNLLVLKNIDIGKYRQHKKIVRYPHLIKGCPFSLPDLRIQKALPKLKLFPIKQ